MEEPEAEFSTLQHKQIQDQPRLFPHSQRWGVNQLAGVIYSPYRVCRHGNQHVIRSFSLLIITVKVQTQNQTFYNTTWIAKQHVDNTWVIQTQNDQNMLKYSQLFTWKSGKYYKYKLIKSNPWGNLCFPDYICITFLFTVLLHFLKKYLGLIAVR